MKKCPYCDAHVEENARFCIYCMKELDKKEVYIKKAFPIKYAVLAAVSLILCAVIAIVASGVPFNKGTSLEKSKNSSYSSNEKSEASSDVLGKEEDEEEEEDSVVMSSEDTSTDYVSSGVSSEPSESSIISSSTTETAVEGSSSSSSGSGEDVGELFEDEEDSGYYWQPIGALIVEKNCEYRPAVRGDTFEDNYNLTDKIVITKITIPIGSGRYFIPETIDGKKVIAIEAGAFADAAVAESVKMIVIPRTVIKLNNYTFAKCSNLKDIYYCGKGIYTELYTYMKESDGALCAPDMVLHCEYSCHNRNQRYYRDIASEFGLTFSEWDGDINI